MKQLNTKVHEIELTRKYVSDAHKGYAAERAKLSAEKIEEIKATNRGKLQAEIEVLEEKLGIDGVKPSEKGKFVSRAVVGTTSYSAFRGPTLVPLQNGEYGQLS